MPKRLIINSDDYGRSPEISQGIRVAHQYGVVTSTTCMMNIPTAADDIKVALKEAPTLGLGVHLVLTMGKPLSTHDAVKSITDKEGNFFKHDTLVKNLPNLNMEEVKIEWRTQIEAFIKAADKRPDHLDSHHHSSYFSPDLFRGMLELAKEYDCPIRFPYTGDATGELMNTHPHVPALMEEFHPRHPDIFIVGFYDKQATHDALIEFLLNLSDGSTELMCHVGFVPDAFVKESSYNKARQRELGILLNPAVRQLIDRLSIELINFSQL
jgi:predicted glycoside hydrolase/deacetylase ChbG (UPF0249 family)